MAVPRHGLDDLGPWTRGRTVVVVAALAIIPLSVILAASFAGVALPVVPSFATIHAYVSGTLALITAVVLIGYAIASRRLGFFALGGAYATMVMTTFAFPFFYPNGLVVTDPPTVLVGGPQSAVALFIYKNIAFVLFMMVGALVLYGNRGKPSEKRIGFSGFVWIGAGVSVGLLGLVLVGPASSSLPILVEGNVATQVAHAGFVAIAVAALVASVVTGLTMRSGSLISLWVFIVVIVEFAGALVTLEADARYTVNWYVNRIFGTLALAVLLLALIRQVARLDRSLLRSAGRDPLTGIRSRLGILAELERRSQTMKTNSEPVVLIWLDLDTFRSVNEHWGYPVGDEVLQTIIARVDECVSGNAVIGRLGGDEVGIVISGEDTQRRGEQIAEEVLQSLRVPIRVADRVIMLSGSIGIAAMPPGSSVDVVVVQADLAMKAAKAAGGDRLRWFEPSMAAQPTTSIAQTRQDFLADVDAGYVGAVYQPIVDASSSDVVGVEALARWRRNGREQAPGEFFGELQRAGMLPHLGRAMIAQVSRDCREIWDAYPQASIFMNFTSSELANEELVQELLASPLVENAGQFVVEVTEQIEFEVAGAGLFGLEQLIAAQVRVAIDDFGSGYSSLERIAAITPAVLKIDRFLVEQVVVNPDPGRKVFSAACALGKSLGCSIIAEGVETPEEKRAVVELGADWIQGYLMAQPVPVSALRTRTAAPSGN